jgi:hypothetical protein
VRVISWLTLRRPVNGALPTWVTRTVEPLPAVWTLPLIQLM